MEPSPTSRLVYEKTITSKGVLRLLWDQYLKNSVADMEYFYDVFEGSSVTASACGELFELRMHQLLRWGYFLKLFPLALGRAASPKNDFYSDYSTSHKQQRLQSYWLIASEEHPLREGIQLEINHYYRPGKNFPSIDSLLLIHPEGDKPPILLMFQITRNKEKHDVKPSDLERVRGLGLPEGTREYYVVVTPLGREPKIEVPKGYFGGVEVFHHPVDRDSLFSPGAVKK